MARDQIALEEPRARVVQRDPAAADRRRPRAAVGLQYVAVDDDLFSHRQRPVTARKERPMRRWISCVRPDCLPFAASRSTRSGLEPGSIEYSAVTQPLPLPRSHGGMRSSTDAVHNTRVRPNWTSTDPAAISV